MKGPLALYYVRNIKLLMGSSFSARALYLYKMPGKVESYFGNPHFMDFHADTGKDFF